MIGRRGFLRGAAVAPLAAKQVAEAAVKNLSGILPGPVTEGGLYWGEAKGGNGPIQIVSPNWLKALSNKALKSKLESIYYERERAVSRIDPDIACHRSISLSAKIAYQRERNVRREIDGLVDREGWYGRFNKIVEDVLGDQP